MKLAKSERLALSRAAKALENVLGLERLEKAFSADGALSYVPVAYRDLFDFLRTRQTSKPSEGSKP